MTSFLFRPPLDPAPELQPPRRRAMLLLPALLAVLGILIAWAAATAGQDARRSRDFLQMNYDRAYWEVELHKAIAAHKPPAEIAKIQKIVDAKRAARLISYAKFGRQFTQWDGYRYEEIVDQGYIFHQPFATTAEKASSLIDAGGPEKRSKNVVWYPLYPLLASGLMHYVPLSSTDCLTAVSWVCCVLASVVGFLFARRYFFHRMRSLQLPISQPVAPYDVAALFTVAFVLFGPCSIFLYANFTESLFLLLPTLFLYCIQARWWWRAAFVAAFASASRSQGVLFGPILALAYVFRGDGHLLKRLLLAGVFGVISAAGLACYMAFLAREFDDPLAFMHAQIYWNVGISVERLLFAANPTNAEAHLLGHLFFKGEIDWPRLWESLCLLWPPCLLLVFGWRYLSFELLLIGWIFWGLPYVSNSMAGNPPFDTQWMSMGRFMAVSLPLYIIFAGVLTRRPILALFVLIPWSAAFALFSYKYGSGAWVG